MAVFIVIEYYAFSEVIFLRSHICVSLQVNQHQLHLVSTHDQLEHHVVYSSMCVRISDAWTRLRFVTSKTIAEITRMKFLVVQIVHLRMTAIRVGDNLQVLTTLTGEERMERHRVWVQDPLLITPWEQHRYSNAHPVTLEGA